MNEYPADHNPFATRFTRPGAVEYIFPPGVSAEALVEKLRAQNWQGAIIGPHGCGKSTLLTVLILALANAGRNVVQAALHQGETKLPPALDDYRTWDSSTQVVVDGYEQLSTWAKTKLAWRCRSAGAGLLITSHEPTALPELVRVSPSLEVAEQVVETLVKGSDLITADDVHAAFRATDGNLREALFNLYDVYESRSRQS